MADTVRRRITFAIVGAVIAALVIAGAGTFVLDRLSAGDHRRELERQAQSLIAILDETTLFRALVNPNGRRCRQRRWPVKPRYAASSIESKGCRT